MRTPHFPLPEPSTRLLLDDCGSSVSGGEEAPYALVDSRRKVARSSSAVGGTTSMRSAGTEANQDAKLVKPARARRSYQPSTRTAVSRPSPSPAADTCPSL